MYCDVCNKKIDDGVSVGDTIDEINNVHYCSIKCRLIDIKRRYKE